MKLKTILSLAVAGSVLVVGAPTAQAQITKQGDAYLFRVKYTKGEVIRHVMTMNFDMGMGAPGGKKPAPMTSQSTQKVLSVSGDKATIEVTMGDVAGTKIPKQKITMDSRGRPSGGGSAQGNISVALPEKAVKVGSTWTGDLSGAMGGTASANATYKLLGFKTVGGKNAANIAFTVKGNVQGMAMSGTGTVLMLTSDGSMYSTSMAMTMNMPAQQKGAKPMNMKMSMTMVRK